MELFKRVTEFKDEHEFLKCRAEARGETFTDEDYTKHVLFTNKSHAGQIADDDAWIPTDQPPTEEGCYLVLFDGEKMFLPYFPKWESWAWMDFQKLSDKDKAKITHWQPTE